MMDIVVGVFFLLFMFLVDWRLSRIHKELQDLNRQLQKPAIQ